jgi:hypothetical protein
MLERTVILISKAVVIAVDFRVKDKERERDIKGIPNRNME